MNILKITFDFPREVMELSTEQGKGFRRIVRSNLDLEKYWAGKNGVSNAFMTVYGYRATQQPYNKRVDLMTPIIRHFVLDFDPKNFRERNRPDVGRRSLGSNTKVALLLTRQKYITRYVVLWWRISCMGNARQVIHPR